MADEEVDTKPNVAQQLSLKVKDQEGGEVTFKVKPSTRFEKILEAYCKKKAVDKTTVRFLFDGQRLTDLQTPEEIGMEEGDCIDCVIQQVGGC